MLDSFHFLRPEWLIAIPFVALLLIYLIKHPSKSSGWENICDPALLKYQMAQQNNWTSVTNFRLLSWTVPIIFLISLLALAGPSWEKKEQPVFQQGNALVIILDLSLSMNARDLKPSRLERAKLKLIDILQQKKEGQTALIAFAGDAHTVSPLTIDNKTIMSLLPSLDSSIMPLTGSDLIDALTTAKLLFKNAGFAQGDILLLSDGFDSSQQKTLEKDIKKLRRQGYRFSVIGVGSQAGSPIPKLGKGGFIKDQSGQVVLSKLTPTPLKKLTQIGGGQYHTLSLNDNDFQYLLEQTVDQNNDQADQDKQLEQWVDAGAYLSLFLIPLALSTFRKGLLSIVLCLSISASFISEPVYAEINPDEKNAALKKQINETWKKLWSTSDQQAQKSFNAKDYTTAADNFTNKDWKASANYRAGNFEKALEQYSQLNSPDSLYNKGNTLANMNKFKEAIAAYESAIKESTSAVPSAENKQNIKDDAQKNLDYLKELLAKQQEQQSSDKNSDQKNDDSEQQSQEQNKEQQNSSDDASKSNESNAEESEPNESEDSKSEGADSGEKEEEGSDSEKSSKEQDQDSQTNNENEQMPDEAQTAEEEKKEKPEDEAKQQAQSEPVEEDSNNQDNADSTKNDVLSQLSQEEQQSLKQWLQRIPDNPGELLRIKFRNNTLMKQRNSGSADTQYEGNPW
ncbi:MAG: VWA domain-containing protein [Gammaproteobacteria bacterium]|nr:VWA domain-containing protein [Gammaproteobacteria bacterium]